ncbi:MAG TPA: endo-1,3-alpha-glucanase family glycosylhydrolase [Terriglobales bacterium]|nr:endo-1,3-alpha-glucanase family glycosylhydrolase [Terriglobales bacterium]
MKIGPNRLRLLFFPCILAAALAPLASCARPNLKQALRASTAAAPNSWPQILAAYQPWFGEKNHASVGYSSNDPVALQKQITEAKNLGIVGFVVNWYGPGKSFEDGNYALLQNLAARNDFKTAIQYDEAVDSPGSTTDAVVNDLRYAYDRYIGPKAGPSREAYLRYDGRPLIFIFPKNSGTDWNQVRQAVESWPDEDRPLLITQAYGGSHADAFDGFYAWVGPGSQGWAPDGSHWGGRYLDNFYQTMISKYPDKLAVGAAWPGFDDSHAPWSQNRHISPRCGKTFDDTLRMFRAYYSDSRPLPFLMIDTWNDYEEGTAIEKGLPRC